MLTGLKRGPQRQRQVGAPAGCTSAPGGPGPRTRPDSWPHEVVIRVRPAIPIELPRLADLLDLVEVHVADEQLLVVGIAQLADELAARVAEVRLPVEVVVAQVLLDPDPVDRPDEIAVRHCVADLLDPPQVLAETT